MDMIIDDEAPTPSLFKGASSAMSRSENSPSKRKKDLYSWDEKFVWNFYLLQDLLPIIKFKKWILPVVHGYINVLSKQN
jgi:SacI homology domain